MPLYVYKCKRCDCIVEEIQKVGDPPPTYDCLAEDLKEPLPCAFEKQMTSASFKFRAGMTEGGGWIRSGPDGETMIRQVRGNNTTKYGEGSV